LIGPAFRELLLSIGSYVPLLCAWAAITVAAAIRVPDRRVGLLLGIGTVLHVCVVALQLAGFLLDDVLPTGTVAYFVRALLMNGLQALAWSFGITAVLLGRSATSEASSPPASA
jgi:hypothetical protein